MSLLQEVIEQYGDSSSEKPKVLTDKTDKRGSVSFGSEWSEGLKTKKEPATESADRIDWGESPLVQSVDKRSKELRESPNELRWAPGEDWSEVRNDPAQLVAFADSLAIVKIRESGRVPDHYNFVTHCRKCGDVPVYEGLPRAIEQCPWCMNGLTAPPIPGARE